MDLLGAHILSGLGGRFIKQMMGLAKTSSLGDKTVLFNQGDPATRFYMLVNGRVALGIGEPMHTTYIAQSQGEAIGWSSLTGSPSYTASAICIEPTKLLQFQQDQLKTLLADHPDVELKFYRNLSQTLENRLLQSFELLSSLASASGTTVLNDKQIYDPFELL